MDGITQLFSGATGQGGWLTKALPYLQLGMAGSGSIGNILANRTRNNVLSKEMAQMSALTRMTPAQIMSGIVSLERPLSANLTNSVGNTVQGQLAERGLSQAPGIFASSLSQGLAPYQLQEQQIAQDAFFKKLGLPISARPSPFGPFPQSTNTSQLWQSIFKQFAPLFQNKGSGGITTGPATQDPGLDTWLPFNIDPGLVPLPITGSTDFPSTQPGGG